MTKCHGITLRPTDIQQILTPKEKIVLISETFQNLEIGQLYLDKGLK